MEKQPKFTVQKLKDSTRHLPPALRLVWQADRRSVVALLFITVVSSVIPVGQALMAQWIVDSVLAAAESRLATSEGLWRISPFLAGEFVLLFSGLLLTQWRRYVSELLNQRLSQAVATRIMTSAAELDIHYFEDAAFLDKLQSARQETKFRAMALVNAGFLLVQNVLTLLSFVMPMLIFSPWIALVLFGSALPAFVAQTYYSHLSFRLHTWRAPEGRRMYYYEHLMTSDSSAKEIRVFRLAKWFIDRHRELFERVFKEDQRLAMKKSMASVFWGTVSTLSFYGCFGWIILQAIARAISLGQMTFYLTSFKQLQGTFIGLFENVNSIYESGLFMQNLFAVLEAPRAAGRELRDSSAGFRYDVSRGIEFRNVSFRYPGSYPGRYPGQSGWALKDFSLTVKPGQTIALVGENGSGKSTLIKLLTRLYEPTEGGIVLFGQPLERFPPEELYELFGAIFQDFVHYQTTLRENVGFGAIDAHEDRLRLESAVHRGGATDVVNQLPEGWETMLGGWFQKGRQLSGGQWQRVALSRAFMRNAEILILDEPTSSLDAANEQAIFSRLQDMAKGKIVFLVSHRFSTVRTADQVIVLHAGQVVESGTHDELMLKRGSYSRLFELQAEGYR